VTQPLCTIGCGAPSPGAYICRGCADKLRRALRDITERDLMGALVEGSSRQTQFSSSLEGAGSRSANTPLPWDDRASRRVRALERLLDRWAWTVADARGITGIYGLDWPRTGAAGAATFLLDHIDWLCHHQQGVTAWRVLTAAIDSAWSIIDRPETVWYAGPCTAPVPDDLDGYCATDLYAKPDGPIVTCRTCGTHYDVKERRGWLLTASENYLADGAFIARALSSQLVDVPVTPERIRKWHSRGRIVAHGYDNHRPPRPLFRIGDILDRLGEDVAARDRRRQETA
jgi:hypothetical protein